jgi:hypothetical protein
MSKPGKAGQLPEMCPEAEKAARIPIRAKRE